MVSVQVLLAAYNGEAWLPEQLDSLLCQTERNFTVLYQDDGSSDGTAELLARRSGEDPRLRAGREQGCRLGARGNFLSLIRQTRADRVLLCDQDDVWEPRKIARLQEAMDSAERRYGPRTPLVVHSDCRVIDGTGQELFPSFFRHQGWDPAAVELPRLLVQNNVTGCTLMMNRPLTDLVAAFAEADRIFMHDWFIALTAAAFGRVVFLDEPLIRYRQHAGNAVGASGAGQVSRGLKAVARWKEGRNRIRLTYSHTRAFLALYGDRLPASARKTAEDYLATEALPKPARLLAIKKQGCVMQSPVTRLGQFIFG